MLDTITIAQFSGLCVLLLQIPVAIVGFKKSDSDLIRALALCVPLLSAWYFFQYGVDEFSNNGARIRETLTTLYGKVENEKNLATSKAQMRAVDQSLKHHERDQGDLDTEEIARIKKAMAEGGDSILGPSMPELEAPVGDQGYFSIFTGVRSSINTSIERARSYISSPRFESEIEMYRDRNEEMKCEGEFESLRQLAADIGFVTAKNGPEYMDYLPMWSKTRRYILEQGKTRANDLIESNRGSMEQFSRLASGHASAPSSAFDSSPNFLLALLPSLSSAFAFLIGGKGSRRRVRASLFWLTLSSSSVFLIYGARVNNCADAIENIENDLTRILEMNESAFAALSASTETVNSIESDTDKSIFTLNVHPPDEEIESSLESLVDAHEDLRIAAERVSQRFSKLQLSLFGAQEIQLQDPSQTTKQNYPKMIGIGAIGIGEYWVSKLEATVHDTLKIDALLEAKIADSSDGTTRLTQKKFRRLFLATRLRTTLELLWVGIPAIEGQTKSGMAECAAYWARAAIHEFHLESVLNIG